MIRTLSTVAGAALLLVCAAPATAGPTDDVRAAIMKFAGLSSYEMVATTQGRVATIDITTNPRAMSIDSNGYQMVNVGDTTYMKIRGAWQKFPSSASRRAPNPGEYIQHMTEKAKNLSATDLGWKSVAGERVHAYRVTQNGGGSGGVVYIGGDGYPHGFEDHGDLIKVTKFNSVPPIRAPI